MLVKQLNKVIQVKFAIEQTKPATNAEHFKTRSIIDHLIEAEREIKELIKIKETI